MRGVSRRQETSEQLLAAIVDLSPRERPTGHGAINGGVNFAEQTSQDILEVRCYHSVQCVIGINSGSVST